MQKVNVSYLILDNYKNKIDRGQGEMLLSVYGFNQFDFAELMETIVSNLERKLTKQKTQNLLIPSRIYFKKQGIQNYILTYRGTEIKRLQSSLFQYIPSNNHIEVTIALIKSTNVCESKKSTTRAKERLIKEVIELVLQWRKQYSGLKDVEGKLKQVSLDKAAKNLGVVRKTLDDWLRQIKLGIQNGFNFENNKNNYITVLRKYNKKYQEIMQSTNEENQEEEHQKRDYDLENYTCKQM